MGCNCKNNSGTLAWVVGNDVLLKLWLWEKTATKEYKQTTLPFPLEEATELVVVARADYGKDYSLSFSLSEDSENCLLVEIPSTLGVGTYSLCVKCVLRGRDACSLEEFTFQIVRSNKDANVTFERIGDARQAEYSMEFQMVPSAVARGANAYELWLEQGHEGSIDDFLDYYIATLATEEEDGLMSHEDKKKLDDLPSSTELESKLDELDDAIGDEERRAEQAEQTLGGAISGIESKIPEQASEQNQLADKNFVNSSISTATAIYRGAYNLVSDLGLTTSATEQQIAAALATKMAALGITPDNNDYCFVQVPTADATPTQIERVDRYKFNGTAWLLEFSLNNSGFTAAQWAALNSGITTGLVTKLIDLPTNSELTALLNGKQAVISDIDTIRSGAAAGATAYQKPSTGIPANDIAPNVIPDVSNFITKSVDDLLNYYLKSETYTKQEVQTLIDAVKQFTYEVVQTLPTATADTMHKIYLVPSADPQAQNVKDEFITIDNGTESQTRYTWEQIGSTAIDLSGYVTTTALNTALADYTTTAQLTTLLSGKQDTLESGTNIKTINNESILGAGNITIQGGGGASYTPTLQSAPTSSTTTYTKDGQTVNFEVGQFCRVLVAGSYDFYQLYANSNNVATWEKVVNRAIKTFCINFQENADIIQWVNGYGQGAHVIRFLGVNVASVKVSYGSVLEEVHQLGVQDFTVADGQVLTLKIVRTADGQDASLTATFELA